MGSSSSKSPEEIYLHTVNASAALFKSIAQRVKGTDTESKQLTNFFAEYRQCFELGDLVLSQELHVKHAGLDDSRMDFPEWLIKKKIKNVGSPLSKPAAAETLEAAYAEYQKVDSKIRPELLRSRIVAGWILHDEKCEGELPLGVLKSELIGKMEFNDRYKNVILRQLSAIPKKSLHLHHSEGNNHQNQSVSPTSTTSGSGNICAENEDRIPFTILCDILESIALWRELEVYWKMNFETEKEAMVRGNFLTAFEFGKFLRGNQLEAGNVQRIQQLAQDVSTAYGGVMDRYSFLRFLTDPELNPAFDNEKFSSVYHDMKNAPLPNYFIAASFKTYLVDPVLLNTGASSLSSAIIHQQQQGENKNNFGPFANAKCSVDRYRQVLSGENYVLYPQDHHHNQQHSNTNNNNKKNLLISRKNNNNISIGNGVGGGDDEPENHSVARFIDIDVWENFHKIKETFSLGAGTGQREADFVVGPDILCPNNIPLNEVLKTIRDCAFAKSPFPVIISLGFPENMSLEKQKLLAQQLKRGLNNNTSGESTASGGGGSSDSGRLGNIFCPRTDEDNPLIEPHDWNPHALRGKFVLGGRTNASSSAAAGSPAKKNSASSSAAVIGNHTTKIHIVPASQQPHHINPDNKNENNIDNDAAATASSSNGVVAKELEDLFFLHHLVNPDLNELAGNTPDDAHEAPKNFRKDAISRCALRSFSDDTANSFSVTHPKTVAQVSYANFIRVIPCPERLRKMQNFYPHALWEAGVQIVSLYWWKPQQQQQSQQSSSSIAQQNNNNNNLNTINDEPIRLYRNRFADNGNCGYLLRPDSLLRSRLPSSFFPPPPPPQQQEKSNVPPEMPEIAFSATSKAKFSFSTKFPQHQRFMFAVLSGFCLPQPKTKLFENEKVNPFVIVKIEGPGHAPNRVLLRTGSVRDNAFHPSFVNVLPEKTALLKFKHDMETKGNLEMVIADGSNNNNNNQKSSASTTTTTTSQPVTPRKNIEQQQQQQQQVDSYEHHALEFPSHCSTELEVFIPEMSQLVVQVYHDRKGVFERLHNSNNPEAMGLDDSHAAATDLDKYQLQARGQFQDVLLAEAALPMHLLNRGVRCVRLRCLESGSTDSLLMVKIGPLKDPFVVAEEEKEREEREAAEKDPALKKKLVAKNYSQQLQQNQNNLQRHEDGTAAGGGGGEFRSELSMLLSGGETSHPNYNGNNDLNGGGNNVDEDVETYFGKPTTQHNHQSGHPMTNDLSIEFSL